MASTQRIDTSHMHKTPKSFQGHSRFTASRSRISYAHQHAPQLTCLRGLCLSVCRCQQPKQEAYSPAWRDTLPETRKVVGSKGRRGCIVCIRDPKKHRESPVAFQFGRCDVSVMRRLHGLSHDPALWKGPKRWFRHDHQAGRSRSSPL